MKTIFVCYKYQDAYTMCICNSWHEAHKELFNPSKEPVYITDFILHGGDYYSRQSCAHDIAVNVQNALCDVSVSYAELLIIQRELERIGRCAGLLREFKENGIV